MGKRIIFTGGSGKVGRWVIDELLRYGHQILNLDVVESDNPSIHTMKCDIADAGQVFSAFNTNFTLTEPLAETLATPPDAVIHFAGYPQPLRAPDTEVFRVNVMGFHNVVEAACKMGVKKIILASSVTTYGIAYGQGLQEYESFPVDEKLDCNPTDSYALSKLVGERVARTFATRFKVDIYCLRIGRVILPHEYDHYFESYVYSPESWAIHGWSYSDVRDLGQMCHRGLETDGLGWQVFNATNDTITTLTPTMKLIKGLYPHAIFTRDMDAYEAPVSNRKIREMLGFKQDHNWPKYFTKWRDEDEEKAANIHLSKEF